MPNTSFTDKSRSSQCESCRLTFESIGLIDMWFADRCAVFAGEE